MARLASSLVRARAAIDKRWPNRDRSSDGWIGDEAHQARASDHNENERGLVDAIDVDTIGGPDQVHTRSILAAFMTHPATNYVIHNGRVYHRGDRFRPRVYTGTNKHTGHVHESIVQATWAETSTAPWPLLIAFPAWGTMRKGSQGEAVRQLQAYLNAWRLAVAVDGVFGSETDRAVRIFQSAKRIAVDGIVGPQTRGKLFS